MEFIWLTFFTSLLTPSYSFKGNLWLVRCQLRLRPEVKTLLKKLIQSIMVHSWCVVRRQGADGSSLKVKSGLQHWIAYFSVVGALIYNLGSMWNFFPNSFELLKKMFQASIPSGGTLFYQGYLYFWGVWELKWHSPLNHSWSNRLEIFWIDLILFAVQLVKRNKNKHFYLNISSSSVWHEYFKSISQLELNFSWPNYWCELLSLFPA